MVVYIDAKHLQFVSKEMVPRSYERTFEYFLIAIIIVKRSQAYFLNFYNYSFRLESNHRII